ncbi:hypothetical protein BKA69DRAFT_1066209 [Paraphysoderma sedebokerense]|nr:hypothetical protein BKA69DRAFT_1066209 [Paraphysoderma sedebokerense]
MSIVSGSFQLTNPVQYFRMLVQLHRFSVKLHHRSICHNGAPMQGYILILCLIGSILLPLETYASSSINANATGSITISSSESIVLRPGNDKKVMIHDEEVLTRVETLSAKATACTRPAEGWSALLCPSWTLQFSTFKNVTPVYDKAWAAFYAPKAGVYQMRLYGNLQNSPEDGASFVLSFSVNGTFAGSGGGRRDAASIASAFHVAALEAGEYVQPWMWFPIDSQYSLWFVVQYLGPR